MAKYTEAKARANKKWDEKNKERKKYISKRSTAKSFILNLASEDDLELIEKYITQRRENLNNISSRQFIGE